MAERREPTEPILPRKRRGSTEPLEAAPGPEDARRRRLWLAAGILALALAFFVGFLVGREQEAEPTVPRSSQAETVKGPRAACARALEVADRGNRLLRRAVATQGAISEATVRGDTETAASLRDELESLSGRYDRAEARLERLTDRCRGAT
jgi:hypothetical protein